MGRIAAAPPLPLPLPPRLRRSSRSGLSRVRTSDISFAAMILSGQTTPAHLAFVLVAVLVLEPPGRRSIPRPG